MRKLLFSVTFLTTTLLNAQVEPLDQFFNKSFIPSLVEYDSIAVSLDSGASFNAIATASQHYFTNGIIDTLVIEQFNIPQYAYEGTLAGRMTTIVGSEISTSNIIDKMEFRQDSLYRDSTVAYYDYNGVSYQLFFEAAINYTTPSGNLVDEIDIYADLGSGLTRIGSYRYFYIGANLDSVYYTVSMTSNNDGYFKYIYDSGNPSKALALETYEDIDNDGEKDLIQRLIFDHNMMNEVVQIREFVLNTNNNLEFTAEIHFDTRKNSTISLPETGETNIGLYPNPARHYVQLDYDEQVLNNYEIYNLSGQLMAKGKLDRRLDVSYLPKGQYIFSFIGSRGKGHLTFQKM